MVEPERQENSFPWSTLVVAGLVIAGYWIIKAPISSQRPERIAPISDALTGPQTVNARLWQDPFESVQKYAEKELQGKSAQETEHDPGRLANEIRRLTAKTNVVILSVMVPGGQYAEDIEHRIRARRAVHAAIGTQQYVPVDDSHLGLALYDWPKLGALGGDACISPLGPYTNQASRPFMLPFEWFRLPAPKPAFLGNSNIAERVLVLWVNEQALASQPLLRMAMIDQSLRPKGDLQTNLTHSIVGPFSSSILKLCVQEIEELQATTNTGCIWDQGKAWPFTNILGQLRMFSPYATVPDSLLWPSSTLVLQKQAGTRETTARVLGRWLRGFESFVPTDEATSYRLMQELKHRGVDTAAGSKDAIVLISEHDTLYARSLRVAFAAAYKNSQPDSPDSAGYLPGQLSKTMRQIYDDGIGKYLGTNKNLLVYSFLRGVDGERPTEVPPTPQRRPATVEQIATTPTTPQKEDKHERSEGSRQFDYLRRLAPKIRQETSGSESSPRRVKAIGLLCNDFYDKIVILQALRPEFPEAVFFTLDLDARMLDDTHLPYTRNLLVGSGGGLDLEGRQGFRIGSFRNDHQTAVYTAVRAAVALADDPGQPTPDPLAPTVYEIGRTRAVPTDSSASVSDRGERQWLVILWLVGIVLIAWVVYLGRWLGTEDHRDAGRCVHSIRVLYIVGILWLVGWIVIAALAYLDSQACETGEPVLLFEGVSGWTPVFVRWFHVGFCLVVGAGLQGRFCGVSGKLAQEFWLELPSEASRGVAGGEPSKRKDPPCRCPSSKESHETMTDIWKKYRAWSGGWRVVVVVLAGVAGVLGIALVLGWLAELPTTVSIRGDRARRVHQFTVWGSLLAQIAITVWGLYHIAWTCWLMSKLRGFNVPWSVSTHLRFAKRFKVIPRFMDPWIDVHFVAEHTKGMRWFVWAPFVAWLILILAHNSGFEQSWLPLEIKGLLVALALSVALSAWLLRSASQKVRRSSLLRLEEVNGDGFSRSRRDSKEDPAPLAGWIPFLVEDFAAVGGLGKEVAKGGRKIDEWLRKAFEKWSERELPKSQDDKTWINKWLSGIPDGMAPTDLQSVLDSVVRGFNAIVSTPPGQPSAIPDDALNSIKPSGCAILLRNELNDPGNVQRFNRVVLWDAYRNFLKDPDPKDQAALLERTRAMLIDEVRRIRDGAFGPLLGQPFVQVLLVPLSGYGGLMLLEWLAFH